MTASPKPDVAEIARGLPKAQRVLVLASEPDDIDGKSGCGVEIRGPQYKVARSLEAIGLGSFTYGSPYFDMYWNFALGLAVRAAITKETGDGN